jgi:hypothetical protein
MMAAAGAGGDGPPATIGFTIAGGISSNSSTPTFSVNAGVRTGKWILAIFASTTGAGAADPTAVTFAGISLTKIIANNTGRNHASIWISDSNITTDGTDEIVISGAGVTWAGGGTGGNSTQAAVYAVDNLQSTAASDTATSDASPSVLDVDVPAGGVVVGSTYNGNSTTPVWSGMSATSGDTAKTGGTFRASTQHNSFSTAQSPASISVTTGGTTTTASVSAAFR